MSKQPNILLIVTDQEYAHQPVPEDFTLPSRERIRDRGVSFNHHHATTTVCTPSRSVMYTGQHTHHTRMFDNTNFAWIDDMKADSKNLPTIGHMLRDLGYYTAYKGKWHLSEFPTKGSRVAMESYGFSDYQDTGDVQGGPLDGAQKDGMIAGSGDWLAASPSPLTRARNAILRPSFATPNQPTSLDNLVLKHKPQSK